MILLLKPENFSVQKQYKFSDNLKSSKNLLDGKVTIIEIENKQSKCKFQQNN